MKLYKNSDHDFFVDVDEVIHLELERHQVRSQVLVWFKNNSKISYLSYEGHSEAKKIYDEILELKSEREK